MILRYTINLKVLGDDNIYTHNEHINYSSTKQGVTSKRIVLLPATSITWDLSGIQIVTINSAQNVSVVIDTVDIGQTKLYMQHKPSGFTSVTITNNSSGLVSEVILWGTNE